MLPWVNSPNIILTEEELTREIGDFDGVHVGHLRGNVKDLEAVKDQDITQKN